MTPRASWLAAVAVLLLAAPAAAEPGPWKPVWADEFDGDRLDLSKWSHAVDCGGGGNDERQCYVDSPDIVSVAGGVLRLKTVKRKTTGLANPWAGPVGPMKTGDYASGKVLTKGKVSWRYGRIEARARVPGGQGVWPAIWMMPETDAYGGWPRSGEIDILETVNLGAPCDGCEGGRENRLFGTIHFAGDAAGGHRRSAPERPCRSRRMASTSTPWSGRRRPSPGSSTVGNTRRPRRRTGSATTVPPARRPSTSRST
jgi:beta-glucanase (GH16 family)